jgi:four helix bundle protein
MKEKIPTSNIQHPEKVQSPSAKGSEVGATVQGKPNDYEGGRKGRHPTYNLQHPEKIQDPSPPKKGAMRASGLVHSAGNRTEYSLLHTDPLFLNESSEENKARHPFDLEERTAVFGEQVVRFSKKIPRDPSNNRLIDQLVGCSSSIGANCVEANESFSKKDFRFSISRCVKEAKETKHFLRLVAASEPDLVEEARRLYRECHELHLIFATIFRKQQKQ